MSLVNDALKRAKDAQTKSTPSAPAPQLPPTDAAPAEKPGLGMTVPLIIVVCTIVGLFIVWQNRQKTVAREPATEPKPVAPIPVVSEPKPVAVSTPAPVAPTAATHKPAATPVPVASAPAPALKLQAIFFAPGRSTAIISGKTVRVGNTFLGYRVASITAASATLVSATETNVMRLDQ